MECVVAIEFLRGRNDELVAKEVAIVSNNVMETHHFKSPYSPYMPEDDGDDDNFNGLSWSDGLIEYSNLFTVLKAPAILHTFTATAATLAIFYTTCYKSRFTI